MPTPDSGQAAMEELERQWYTTVVAGLGLDADSFQLLRPTTPLGDTSDKLWAYFNNIPPLSLSSHFADSGGNHFYDDYRDVVHQLIPSGMSAFNKLLADHLEGWEKFLSERKPEPDVKELPELFKKWAPMHGCTTIAVQGVSELESAANGGIARAQSAVRDTKEFKNGVPNFSETIEALREAIEGAERRSFRFDSKSAQSNVEHTWAKGSVSGLFDFFSGGASGSFSLLSTKATSAQIIAKVDLEHVLTFRASPGAWYNSAALVAAYAKDDNNTWKHGLPDWESTFGTKGAMQRFATSLVVVDGIKMALETGAQFSTEEQKEITARASAGFWPFFSASASGGFSGDPKFDTNGKMKVESSSPGGNPVVFGVNVTPVAAYIAGGH
jgi:hypothetical protein